MVKAEGDVPDHPREDENDARELESRPAWQEGEHADQNRREKRQHGDRLQHVEGRRHEVTGDPIVSRRVSNDQREDEAEGIRGGHPAHRQGHIARQRRWMQVD
jgi:hypothetical protein